jgi:hypothetical protein
VGLGPIVVNGVYPELAGLDADPVAAAAAAGVSLRAGEAETLAAAAAFRRSRAALHEEQVGRLQAALPLPQVRLPFLFTTDIGPKELEALARCLLDEIAALPGLPA